MYDKVYRFNFCDVFNRFGYNSTKSSNHLEKDFKKALVALRESGKPILLFFTALNCHSCKEMDEQYWASETVVEAVKQFVAFRIIFDSEKPLAAKYNMTETPLVAFTDPLGNLIGFWHGFDKYCR